MRIMTKRERFERWARRRGYPIERDHTGEYLWPTEYKWEGWQARALRDWLNKALPEESSTGEPYGEEAKG